MRLYCQVRSDIRRERLPTNAMLGFKEAFEDGAEGSGLPGRSIA